VRDGLRAAIAAFGFLTAIPLGRRAAIATGDLARGVLVFPLVGALVGALVALVAWLAAVPLPPLPAAALGVTAGVGLTGAMHLDGLADTADGIGAALAGQDPTAAMADPRLGTFGGAAVALDLLLKVSVLAGFLGTGGFPWVVLAAGALARAAMLALLLVLPYAGPGDGAGAWTGSVARARYLVAIAIAAAIGLVTAGATFPPMVIVAALVGLGVGAWSSRHLSGMRGDTLGAAAELTETLALTAALAVR
jgi:adenosylcobinamide-GDP ribazoletransferase